MARRSLLPLVILLIVIGIAGAIGYIVYKVVQDVTDKTRAKMEKKNLHFSKDGMKVRVREVKDEDYRDKSQSVLVNMWNNTSFPAYKSRLWNMQGPAEGSSGAGVGKRKPHSK